jgi:gluconolactonase
LLFSDIPQNKTFKWHPTEGLSVFADKVGYTGSAPFLGPEPGTNGLAIAPDGRVMACCHGDRCMKRFEKDGSVTTLVDRYQGKRLNSPNDCTYHSNGDLYFTDPSYGLPKKEDDPDRELAFNGVYRYSMKGELTLLTDQMTRPNGLAFSPDEKTLYVSQSDAAAALWNAFPVLTDGTLGPPRVVANVTPWKKDRPGSPDGMTVDNDGRLWATGPGGVYCMLSDGKFLGRIDTGERTANCIFGDDGSTLYVCAHMYLCRIKTNVRAAHWW